MIAELIDGLSGPDCRVRIVGYGPGQA